MTRSDLSATLKALGIRNVYFQPSESVQIKYPCLIYHLDDIAAEPADDMGYKLNTAYQLVYVTKSPTEQMVHKLAMLPKCTFERFYTADELNHYVYRIFI